MAFVSLHNHTHFSIAKALPSPEQLLQKAKDLGQSACAITDNGALIAGWDGLKHAKKLGIKLIIGCEFYFCDDVTIPQRLRHLILIAKNHTGYKNLLLLSKLGNDNLFIGARRNYPRIDWKMIEANHEGLICLTGGASGILGQLISTRRIDEAKEQAKRLKSIFGEDFGLEIQPNNLIRLENNYSDYMDQRLTNNQMIKFSKELDVKIVPTCNTHFLEKDHHEAHDVFMAIGAGQSVKSNNRPKYTEDFYFKSEEEVKNYFGRLYPNEVDGWIANTIYFADKCEEPDWIHPKYSNPSGKELPEFPVKDQKDYNEFLEWKKNPIYPCQSEQETKLIQNLKEDAAYFRYLIYKNFDNKTPNKREQEYHKRLIEELDVIEYRDFSSYMLMVNDMITYCKNNNIPVNFGRGCLNPSTLILSEQGYKPLKEIQIGDKIYSHTGKLQEVINKYEFDINEKCLKIKTFFQLYNDDLILTKDHKIWAIKKENYNSQIEEWIPADQLRIGDAIITKIPQRNISNLEIIDLANFCQDYHKYEIFDNEIKVYECPIRSRGIFSTENIEKVTGVCRHSIQRFRAGKIVWKSTKNRILNFLSKNNISYEDWCNYEYASKKINRFIQLDEEFFYQLGLWIGDGCYTRDGLNIAFNAKDNDERERTKKYFSSIDCDIRELVYKNNCTSVLVNSKFIKPLFMSFFGGKTLAASKCLPIFFHQLKDSFLINLIRGLIDSDGHSYKNYECIVTISKKLAIQLKEALLYLGIPAGITGRMSKHFGGKNFLYNIVFSGINSNPENRVRNSLLKNGGYRSRIREIEEIDCNKVADLTVNEDHSFLTINGAVHNSVGGALCGYYSDIHQIDSIKYDLVFARFQNKEKASFPDVDTDFSQNGKPKVENYIREKYGNKNVAKISNYLTLSPKQYVKAMARAFQFGGDIKSSIEIGQKLSDLIPIDTSGKEYNDVDECIEKLPILAEFCKKYSELEKHAKLLQNKPIALGMHAAGVVIGKRDPVEIVPVRKDETGELILEFEKERAEECGLIKVDLLGLSTLDIIEDTINLIKLRNKQVPQINFDEYDQKTYDLISSGKTMCIFQFGTSAGTIDLCKKIKPKNIEDLSIITTLARPHAKTIREPFVATRNGKKKIKYIHKGLENAFSKTLGYPLYEESLLVLVSDIAGWNLHEADRLRKMTKDKGKHPEKEKQIKEDFIRDAQKNGKLSEEIANKIWNEIIANYSSYSFNKSHSCLYSLTSYYTAYLKAHYPIEFLTANLNFESNSNSPKAEDNILAIKRELREFGIKIIQPDINTSERFYKIIDDKTILAGFEAIKFIGTDSIPDIIEKRPFSSFEDFLSKVDGKKIRSTAIQALSACGALDSFGLTRKQMFLYASDFKKKVQLWQKKTNPGEFKYLWPEKIDEWTIAEKFAMEKHYIGEGLSGTYFQIYPNFFSPRSINFKDLAMHYDADMSKNERMIDSSLGLLQGVIVDMREFLIKKEDSKLKGQMMMHLSIQDPYGNLIKGTLFPDTLKNTKEKFKAIYGSKIKLEIGTAILFNGTIDFYQGEIGIVIDCVKNCAASPSKPEELKAQKVAMRIPRKKKDKIAIEPEEILEEMEEEMAEEGLNENE